MFPVVIAFLVIAGWSANHFAAVLVLLREQSVSQLLIDGAFGIYAVGLFPTLILGDASTTLSIYGHLWDEDLDTIPSALDAHLAAEREHDAARAERRKKRTARRDGLRAVPDAG